MVIISIRVEHVVAIYKVHYLFSNEKIVEDGEIKVVFFVVMGNYVLEPICINRIADVSDSNEVVFVANSDSMEHVEPHCATVEEIYEGSNRI